MDKDERTARAKSLVSDEMFAKAFDDIGARIIKQLLSAKTPEEREEKFQEYAGLKRAFELLKVWAATPE